MHSHCLEVPCMVRKTTLTVQILGQDFSHHTLSLSTGVHWVQMGRWSLINHPNLAVSMLHKLKWTQVGMT